MGPSELGSEVCKVDGIGSGPCPVLKLLDCLFVSSLVKITPVLFEMYSGTRFNDIDLCDTSSVTSDILWYKLIPHS